MRRARGIAGSERSVDSAGARWWVRTEPPRHGRVRAHALAGMRGHGPRALPV
jgi:hypothetical protein